MTYAHRIHCTGAVSLLCGDRIQRVQRVRIGPLLNAQAFRIRMEQNRQMSSFTSIHYIYIVLYIYIYMSVCVYSIYPNYISTRYHKNIPSIGIFTRNLRIPGWSFPCYWVLVPRNVSPTKHPCDLVMVGTRWGTKLYPLVNIQKAIENGHL